MSGLPPGRVLLHVYAHAPFLSPAAPISVEAGAGEVEIRLARGREIRGTVVGPDGAPAAGFQVSLQAEGPDVLPGRRCAVEADGSFRLEGVPPVERVALRVSRAPNASGESALLSTTVHAVAVGGEPVSIRLRSGVFVEGTAVGPDGAVVSRGAVVADLRGRAHDGSPVFVDGRLDAQGRFRVGPLDPGPVLLFYEGMMVPWASTRPLPITAPARDVRVPVVRAVTLRGRVLAAAGAAGKAWWNPGVGNLTRLGTPIGPDGGFSLSVPDTVPGLLYVGYAADDRFALREGLLAGTDVLDLALQPGQRIEGRLTGLPADKAPPLSVVARRGDLVLYGESSADGTFHIPAVPPGTYRVEIEYGDYVGGADKIEAGSVGVSISVTRR